MIRTKALSHGTLLTFTVLLAGCPGTQDPEVLRALAVALAGDGLGEVTANPAGVSCVRASPGNTSGSCLKEYREGTTVTLTATPGGGGHVFSGWSGACNGNGSCSILMDQARSVTATFTAPLPTRLLTLSIAGAGGGTITSAPSGINCTRMSGGQASGSCATEFPHGSSVTLTAVPGSGGSTFAQWSGDQGCSGSQNVCSIVMDQARAIVAAFAPPLPSCVWCDQVVTFDGDALPPGWQAAPYGPNPALIRNGRLETFAVDRGILIRAPGPPPLSAAAVEVISEGPFADVYWGMGNAVLVETGVSAWDASVWAYTCPRSQGCGPVEGASNQLVISSSGGTNYSFANQTWGPWARFHTELGAYVSGTTVRVSRLFTDDSVVVTVRRASDNAVLSTERLGIPGFRVASITAMSFLAYFTSGSPLAVAWVDNIEFKVLAMAPPPPGATHLGILNQPAVAVSGLPMSPPPMVEVRTTTGQPVLQAGVVVTAAKASGGGSLGGTLSATTDGQGRASFPILVITGLGVHTLQFSSPGLTQVTTQPMTLVPPPPTSLALITQPGGALPGLPFATQPVIELRSSLNQPVSQAGVPVTVSRTSGQGVLTGTLVGPTNTLGRVAFSDLSLSAPGAHSLQFSAPGLVPVSVSIMVVSINPTALVVVGQPGGATSGIPFTTPPVVELRDGANQPVQQNGVAVAVTKASGAGVLGGTLIVPTNGQGRAQFTDLHVTGTGPHVLTFTSVGLSGAVSASFDVAAAPPAALAVITEPAGAVSGVAFAPQPVIELRDAAGHPVLQAGIAVSVAKNTGTGTLGGTLIAMTNSQGRATFANLSITGSGSHSLTYASTGLTGVAGSSFDVSLPPATQLAVVTQPGGAFSGAAFTTQPIVELRDSFNQPVSQAGVVVTAAKASGSGALGGNLTATTNSQGRATFTNLQITGTGGHTLDFTAPGVTKATSVTFTVSAPAATHLVVITQPAGTTSGSPFTVQPVLELRDGFNQVVLQAGVVVTAVKASGTGTLAGTVTATTNAQGRATFTNLQITGSGSHTLAFTAPGLIGANSVAFTLAPPTATQLAMISQPAGAVSGAAFTTQPVVELRTGSNQSVSQAGVVVTAVKATGSGTLGGTLTATTNSQGRATFTNLQVTGTGSHTLDFTATGLTKATSAAFVVGAVQRTLMVATSGGGSGTITSTPAGIVCTRTTGGVTTGTCTKDFDHGTPVTLLVAPAAGGHTFAGWTGGGCSGTGVSCALTMDQAHTTQASFSPPPGSIHLSPQFAMLGVGASVGLGAQTGAGAVLTAPPVSTVSRTAAVGVTGLTAEGLATGVSDIVASYLGATDSARIAVAPLDGFGLLVSRAADSVFLAAAVGSTVTLDMYIQKPSGGTGTLGALQGGIQWDPSRFQFVSFASLNPAGWTFIENTSGAPAGNASFAAFHVTGVNAGFALARLTLTVIGSGSSGYRAVIPSVTAASDGNGTTITPKVVAVPSAIRIP